MSRFACRIFRQSCADTVKQMSMVSETYLVNDPGHLHAVLECKDKSMMSLNLQCLAYKKLLNRLLCRCPTGTSLKCRSQTRHWGYWYDMLQPALVTGNDTEIDIDMPTFETGLACEGTACPTELSFLHVVIQALPTSRRSGRHSGTIGTDRSGPAR